MTLTQQVDHLRTLARLDPDTTILQRAMVEVLGELAEAVDRLSGPEEPEHGFGTI